MPIVSSGSKRAQDRRQANIPFSELDRLTGGNLGIFDTPCPLCSHLRKSHNQKAKVLRIWREEEGFASFNCKHCGVRGSANDDRPAINIRQRGSVDCHYEYHDESGQPLHRTVRYKDPKGFSQQRINPDNPVDWIDGLGDTRRVLYRLPELIQATAEGQTIYLCEGEKDVHSLVNFGFVATTNAMGAEKWRDEYSEVLRGADVVIIPDNDDAGRKHLEKIASSLHDIAKRIRVVDIAAITSGAKDDKDITDWIGHGGTVERFNEMVAALPGWQPPAAVPVNDEPEWPVLDEAAYHGPAGDVVRTIEPHTEADPVAILIQYLASFGNIVGNSPYYLVESDKHHANIFAVVVGSSAKGRKGTSAGRVEAVVKASDATWFVERGVSGLSTGEGIINAVRDAVTKWDSQNKCNETVDPGVPDKRLLVTEAEFAGALSVMERAGSILSPIIRNAWDGKKLQTLTKTTGQTATGAHISIVAHITEPELRGRLTRTNMANGFANRFLFCCARRSKELPHGGNLEESELVRLGRETEKAVIFAKNVGRVAMTDEAKRVWGLVYSDLSAERPGLLGTITARAEAQVIRLALIYALLDNMDMIDTSHLEAALAVWSYCDRSAMRIFGDALGDPIADDILAALRRSPDGMTRTDIRDLFHRNRNAGEIGTALDLLARSGRARSERQSTGGHPVEVWFATARLR